ncbi:hypothetical protein SAMN05878503_102241 [Cereibacter ovatus]|uniref:Uncharacterized protein n=1 Tax=Cereibacter ovatus TaxID=439529 RepID=A0A285CM78_9RHOB|nr:hypothetical protein [Cereibacter ovatus]SNX68670.1 hypothetical protein SAMN05878503_102241 [Cereibacter ovatus]
MLNWFRPYLPSRIIVPRRAAASGEARDLLTAVQRYLTVMRETGFWLDHELPQAAVLTCRAGTYYAQVLHGGHDRFAFATRMAPGLLAQTQEALTAAGFTEFPCCLADLAQLHAAAPAGGPPPEAVREIDTRFFASRELGEFHRMMGEWLAAQRVLEVVRDGTLDGRLRRAALANPEAAARRRDFAVDALQGRLTLPMQVGLAAAGLVSPKGVCLVRRIGSASFLRVAGREAKLWKIEASDPAVHYGLEFDATFWLLPAPPPRLATEDAAAAFLSGKPLCASRSDILPALRHAREWRPALALALLLRDGHGPEAVGAAVCMSTGDGIAYLLEVAGRRLMLCYTGAVCGLSDLEDDARIVAQIPLAELQREIDAFDARAKARLPACG